MIKILLCGGAVYALLMVTLIVSLFPRTRWADEREIP